MTICGGRARTGPGRSAGFSTVPWFAPQTSTVGDITYFMVHDWLLHLVGRGQGEVAASAPVEPLLIAVGEGRELSPREAAVAARVRVSTVRRRWRDGELVGAYRDSGKDITQSGYVKPLGQGLFELRVDHDVAELAQIFGADLSTRPGLAADAILLRVFCTFYGDKIVLLLSGLDKGADPKAQPRAIRSARKLLADWQSEQAAAKRKSGKR